ncbi:aquaporin family protein [Acidobacteria bacterium AH-259-D05]|nr:aquaporin family protein [Acidobacteria bacterium AH-259-D05]
MAVYLAEAIGTMILVILGDGVVANVLLNKSKGQHSGWMVITTGWGLAVAIAVYSVGRISGAHINPAVTLGLASMGAFPWFQVPAYLLAQMIGAFLGAVIVWLAYFPHWAETEDPSAKRAVFCTIPAIPNRGANFLSELIGTAMLLFGILAISANSSAFAAPGEVDLSVVFSTGLQPLLVGFLVWSIGLSLGGPTGYAINPARDLGPRIAYALLPIKGKGKADWEYSWIPVVAPILGGMMGALLFAAVGF